MFHLIKKYSNRKLYDTYTKSFIRLEDIAELVLNNEEVRIEDSDTLVDITPLEVSKALLKHSNRGKPVGNILYEMLNNRIDYLFNNNGKSKSSESDTESLNYVPAEIRLLLKSMSYLEGVRNIMKLEPPFNKKLHGELQSLFEDCYKKLSQLKKKYKIV